MVDQYHSLLVEHNDKIVNVTTCGTFMVATVGDKITSAFCLLSKKKCIFFNYETEKGDAVTYANGLPRKSPSNCPVGIAYERGRKA